MLLESALADFSQESTSVRGHPSAMPFVWDDKSGSNPFTRSSSYHERISMLSVQENEGLHLHEEAADMFNARKNHKGGGHNRSDSGQFYHKEGTVPFKWEAAPGKPVVAQESIVNPESPRLRPPPALRNVTIPVGCNSPRHGGIAGKVKSILSGKGPRIASSNCSSSSSNASSAISSKSSSHVSDREQWSSSSGREDTDRESSIDSDGGEESSPVSTLDRPASPLSPVSPKPASSNQQELAVVPASTSTSTSVYRQPNYHGLLSRNGSWKHLAGGGANGSGRQHSHMATPLLTMTEMSEELPMIEEDEEDSEFHTMEFSTVDSPGTIEERRERSLLRRPGSSKSMSAALPHVRRQSSLGNASRQRRRSDFDWPEDYDERPEEVVKEVDESLWAFSPVASTFVFSGNDNSGPSGRSPGRAGAVGTGSSTPSSSGSGSLRETLSLRRTLMRSSSTRTGYNGKSSAEAAAAHAELSSQLGPNGRVKSRDDEELYHSSHGRMKRTLSCIPFLNLCRAQRPTPTISFSSRLSPNSATSRK